ncbi:MAG: SURF1 family protein [Candidatus Eisenbacteria bacterium]
MRPGPILLAVALGVLAVVCARMGLWQHARWVERRAANARLERMLAAGPEWTPTGAALDARRTDKVQTGGHWDQSRHLLLSREPDEGGVGVDVVTPLRLADGTLVLVDRGWMRADSAAAAHPERFTTADSACVVALVRPLKARSSRIPWVALAGDIPARFSTLHPDPDTLAARWPDVRRDVWLVLLPECTSADSLRRFEPELPAANVHLSYAIQWAIFTVAALGGVVVVVSRERSRAA